VAASPQAPTLARQKGAVQRDVFLIKRRQITLRRQDTGDPTERSNRRQTTGYNIDSFDVKRGIRAIAIGFPKRDLRRIIFAIINGHIGAQLFRKF
jgi:hypothetical protein